MKRIFPLFLVLFLGSLGFSFTLPLFPPLFLDPVHSFLIDETPEAVRRILLGFLFAVYPIGQFIGAPILGKLSDKCGRRPIVLLCLVFTAPALICSAVSVHYGLPLLLYISRFVSGLLAGNTAIVQASIADISSDAQTKAKRFGWLNSLSSSAFFFGPLIGGVLADSTVVMWFHYDTPFWFATILNLIAFFIIYHLFKETHKSNPEISIKLRLIVTTFIHGFKYKKLRVIYSANFFIFLAMFFFLNFFAPYLLVHFNFSFESLGHTNAYLAIPFIISPLFFGAFTKWWTIRKSMRIGALFICISYLVFIAPSSPWALLITLLPVGFFLAMGFAFPAIMVSDAVDKRLQGQALGTNQSILVFAEAFTALTGGLIMVMGDGLPIYIGAVCAVIAALILHITNQEE